ncbi:uncharacterized protein EDB93DRAFT_1250264 [Suillus bovinus]|uniref:uncharacterized protein n=1 Tax=Suillus bovinus TaxID=48563 RepID=UPI001B8642EE|nr:uncharacterized protein EDB93DRAFT_1250264 [Suillus bovinus]KAG2148197.1 hypothetical protein EDB93DRAFT_1250264 [Suillus bovinus]
MQLSILLGALVSFAILAAASLTPRAISKRAFEGETLGTDFQRDLQEESKKREELKTDFIIYAWYDGPGSGEKKRKELETGINYDEVD